MGNKKYEQKIFKRQDKDEIQGSSFEIVAPEFNGRQHLSKYKKQFEAAASVGDWDVVGKATVLILAIRERITKNTNWL